MLEWFTLSLFSQTTSVPTDTVVSPKSSMAVIEITTSSSSIVVLVLLEDVLLDELLEEELLDDELEELVLDELVLDVPGGGGVGSRPSARPRNDAIWSRRTDSSGQNKVPAWSQPNVTPSSAMALMFPSCTPETSEKRSPGTGSNSIARARNEAICARDTRSVGPNVPSSNPSVIPAAATRLMLSSWVLPSSSGKKSSPAAGNSNPRAMNEAI